MSTSAAILFSASALIVLVLGGVHLFYTYVGPKLYPRDRALVDRMREVPLVISPRTTTWKAGIGFHASHSLGALLFGTLYLYLAHEPTHLLASSPFLLAVGGGYLVAMTILAKAYWFNIPLAGMSLALCAYAAAVVVLVA